MMLMVTTTAVHMKQIYVNECVIPETLGLKWMLGKPEEN